MYQEELVSKKRTVRSKRLYFDGACEPVNPGGLISWGWLLRSAEGVIFDSDCGADGRRGPENTSNVAEYKALIAGLEAAAEGQVKELHVLGDSKLVIKQMQGEWGCKSERLRPLYDRAWELQGEFDRIGFEWIPRERNQEADELTELAYREAGFE